MSLGTIGHVAMLEPHEWQQQEHDEDEDEGGWQEG
jgi:hypothetical protein